MSPASRKLAAIMFTDMVGYGTLTQSDEKLAHALLLEHQALLRSLFPGHGGTEIRTIGDAFLVEFASVGGAVECALAIQRRLFERNAAEPPERRIWLRIGVHLGDVAHEAGDIYGDGVNLAARIQPLAEAGEICISEQVYVQVRAMVQARYESMGRKRLKHVQSPQQVFKVVPREPLPQVDRPPPELPPRSPWRKYLWAAALLLAVVGALWGTLALRDRGEAPQGVPAAGPKTVVILPFENLGPAEEAYFADGVAKEISARLAQISGLSVIEPFSSMAAREGQMPLAEMARKLKAGYVLKGSVRWQKTAAGRGRVRVTPQLVRTSDEVQVWAQVYERELSDLFQVQSEIARSVAQALNLTLGQGALSGLEQRPTSDMEAYDAYLRGLSYFTASTSEENSRLALEMFDRAIARDPGFALALAMASRVHSRMYNSYFDRGTERLRLAGETSQRALTLAPDLPEASVARGLYFYWGHRDYDRALDFFDRALALRPGHTGALELKAYVFRRQGKFEESLALLKRVYPLNPRAAILSMEMGITAALLRRYDEALAHFDEALSLAPEIGEAYCLKARVLLSRSGDRKGALAVLEGAKRSGAADAEVQAFAALLLSWEGRSEEALSRLEASGLDAFTALNGYEPRALLRGQMLAACGRPREAKAAFEEAVRLLAAKVAAEPEDPRYRSALGLALAGLGKGEEALAQGRRAVELLTTSADALEGPYRAYDLARIFAILGRRDEAEREITPLLAQPTWVSQASLQADPLWAKRR